MFISIPKEVFSTVLFGDKFILNLENNNMEYDTEREDLIIGGNPYLRGNPIKEPTKSPSKGPIEENVEGSPKYLTQEQQEKAKVEKEINLEKATDNEINLEKATDNEILDEADEEFIHSKAVEL